MWFFLTLIGDGICLAAFIALFCGTEWCLWQLVDLEFPYVEAAQVAAVLGVVIAASAFRATKVVIHRPGSDFKRGLASATLSVFAAVAIYVRMAQHAPPIDVILFSSVAGLAAFSAYTGVLIELELEWKNQKGSIYAVILLVSILLSGLAIVSLDRPLTVGVRLFAFVLFCFFSTGSFISICKGAAVANSNLESWPDRLFDTFWPMFASFFLSFAVLITLAVFNADFTMDRAFTFSVGAGVYWFYVFCCAQMGSERLRIRRAHRLNAH